MGAQKYVVILRRENPGEVGLQSSQEVVVWLSSTALILTVTNFICLTVKKKLFNFYIDSAHVTLLGISFKNLLLSSEAVFFISIHQF